MNQVVCAKQYEAFTFVLLFLPRTNLLFHLFTGKDGGIAINDFRKLEQINRPFSKRLSDIFPGLAAYRSLSINLFRIEMSNTSSEGYIYPSQLSTHHAREDCLQIDLIRDTSQIRPSNYSMTKDHVLVISNMASFIANRNITTRGKNASKMKYLCRYYLIDLSLFISNNNSNDNNNNNNIITMLTGTVSASLALLN